MVVSCGMKLKNCITLAIVCMRNVYEWTYKKELMKQKESHKYLQIIITMQLYSNLVLTTFKKWNRNGKKMQTERIKESSQLQRLRRELSKHIKSMSTENSI